MLTRRDYLRNTAMIAAAATLPGSLLRAFESGDLITRAIPKTGEELPIVGLGSSATFSSVARSEDVSALTEVIRTLVENGGTVLDTAPSYGASEEVSGRIARDNDLLEERHQLMQQLGGLVESLREDSDGQRAATAQMVDDSGELLLRVGEQVTAKVDGEVAKLSDLAAGFTGSAAEIASLGESFGHAVGLFSESNRELMAKLGELEAAMASSSERSDEQMGYYVAQAREIIDHSMLSQRTIIEELRQLGQNGELFPAEAG